METFWTLDDGTSEQSWADLGIKNGILQRRSLEADELSFIADGQLFDSAELFPYGTNIIIRRDRTFDGTAYDGGTIYFQGISLGGRRTAIGRSESVSYKIAGAWYWLKQDCYEQLIPPLGGWTTHIVLNALATIGAIISMDLQITDILNDCLSKFGAVFAFDASLYQEFHGFFAPSDEKRDLTHAEALKAEFKWAPRTIAWFDYTQTPPFLHINSSVVLGTTSLDLGDQITVTSADIVPRYDMQVSQVIIRYEQTNKIGNNTVLVVAQDIYPLTVSEPTGKMRATVNLFGFSGNEQFATITCADVTIEVNSEEFWTSKHPYLNNVTGLNLHDAIFIDPSTQEPATPLQFEIQEGSLHNWMRVGNSNAGAAGAQYDVHAKVLADYTDQYGNVVVDEEVTVKVKTTNLSSGTYSRLRITEQAENAPTGMARWFYNLLNPLMWEGEVTLEDVDVSAQQFMGKLLNLNNGLPAWSTMQAPIHSTTENLDTGKVVVKFGPNRWLSPDEIIDIIRVTRVRNNTFYPTTMQTGMIENDDVLSPDNLGKENSTRGRRQLNKHVVSYGDAKNNPTTATTDAINQFLSLGTNDPADGSFELALADIRAVQAMNVSPPP